MEEMGLLETDLSKGVQNRSAAVVKAARYGIAVIGFDFHMMGIALDDTQIHGKGSGELIGHGHA